MVYLRTDGLCVHPTLCEILYQSALRLARHKAHELRLAFTNADGDRTGEGSLETQYRTVTCGGIGGIEFRADLAIAGRSFRVTFVIDPEHLGRFVPGQWSDSPMPGHPTSPSAMSDLN